MVGAGGVGGWGWWCRWLGLVVWVVGAGGSVVGSGGVGD